MDILQRSSPNCLSAGRRTLQHPCTTSASDLSVQSDAPRLFRHAYSMNYHESRLATCHSLGIKSLCLGVESLPLRSLATHRAEAFDAKLLPGLHDGVKPALGKLLEQLLPLRMPCSKLCLGSTRKARCLVQCRDGGGTAAEW